MQEPDQEIHYFLSGSVNIDDVNGSYVGVFGLIRFLHFRACARQAPVASRQPFSLQMLKQHKQGLGFRV